MSLEKLPVYCEPTEREPIVKPTAPRLGHVSRFCEVPFPPWEGSFQATGRNSPARENLPDLGPVMDNLPNNWRQNIHYCYGLDLFNAGYWWECHEVMEEVWNFYKRKTPPARCIQAIIQGAIACLKFEEEVHKAAWVLSDRAAVTFSESPEGYFDLPISELAKSIQDYAWGRTSVIPLIAHVS